MFAGVNRANYILEFKDKTTFTGKNQIIAEARFLRAYYHFGKMVWRYTYERGCPFRGDEKLFHVLQLKRCMRQLRRI
jgi:hypothetical protein